MRILFFFFVFFIGNVNADKSNANRGVWKKKKNIMNFLSYYYHLKRYDWIGFEKIKEGKLPLTIYLKNKQIKCEYDIRNDKLLRFDQKTGRYGPVFDKYKPIKK